MGISVLELSFLAEAYRSGILPCGGDILELGDSEIIEIDNLANTVSSFLNNIGVSDDSLVVRASILDKATSRYQRSFDGAKLFYEAVFSYNTVTSVDTYPGPNTICIDLNYPANLGRTFDICINNGTSEHVFNLANVFKFIHDHTRTGGIMLHWTPCLGWLDHGLYNVQPGFFFDLASANHYKVQFAALCTGDYMHRLLSAADARLVYNNPNFHECEICCVLLKTSDNEFQIPFQNDYEFVAQFAAFSENRRPEIRRTRARNIALGRPARQSSTCAWSYNDDPSVDAAGGNNGRITGHYGFHTDCEERPWWRVDLGQISYIEQIRVYNRLGNEASFRARSLEIFLSGDDTHWDKVYSNHTVFGGADGRPLIVRLARPKRARFVKLQLNDREFLHLDEVEVYGRPEKRGWAGHSPPAADEEPFSVRAFRRIYNRLRTAGKLLLP